MRRGPPAGRGSAGRAGASPRGRRAASCDGTARRASRTPSSRATESGALRDDLPRQRPGPRCRARRPARRDSRVPRWAAVSAPTASPVNSSSFVFAAPIVSTSFQVSVTGTARPMRASGIEKRASSAATRMSQCKRQLAPAGDGVALHRGDRRLGTSSRSCRTTSEAAAGPLSPASRCAAISREVEPGAERRSVRAQHDHADACDRRRPARRRPAAASIIVAVQRVSLVGAVEGDGADVIGDVRPGPRRPCRRVYRLRSGPSTREPPRTTRPGSLADVRRPSPRTDAAELGARRCGGTGFVAFSSAIVRRDRSACRPSRSARTSSSFFDARRCCPARASRRTRGSSACTRDRSRHGCRPAARPIDRASYIICAASPSKSRPQPRCEERVAGEARRALRRKVVRDVAARVRRNEDDCARESRPPPTASPSRSWSVMPGICGASPPSRRRARVGHAGEEIGVAADVIVVVVRGEDGSSGGRPAGGPRRGPAPASAQSTIAGLAAARGSMIEVGVVVLELRDRERRPRESGITRCARPASRAGALSRSRSSAARGGTRARGVPADFDRAARPARATDRSDRASRRARRSRSPVASPARAI